MPEESETIFVCGKCGAVYRNKKIALKCELSLIIESKFKTGDFVNVLRYFNPMRYNEKITQVGGSYPSYCLVNQVIIFKGNRCDKLQCKILKEGAEYAEALITTPHIEDGIVGEWIDELRDSDKRLLINAYEAHSYLYMIEISGIAHWFLEKELELAE